MPDKILSAGWVEAFERGLSDSKAGWIVPMEPVLDRHWQANARLEACQQAPKTLAARKT